MDRQLILEGLKVILQDYLKTKNLCLADLIYRYEGKDLVLRILVDRPDGGISLDDCAYINSDISQILDEKEILQGRYILEVSSPGLDRPLKTKSDFSRCINRTVKVFLNEPIKERWELDGIINKVGDDSVYIEVEGGLIEIPLAKVIKAKQIISEAKT